MRPIRSAMPVAASPISAPPRSAEPGVKDCQSMSIRAYFANVSFSAPMWNACRTCALSKSARPNG